MLLINEVQVYLQYFGLIEYLHFGWVWLKAKNLFTICELCLGHCLVIKVLMLQLSECYWLAIAQTSIFLHRKGKLSVGSQHF